MSLSLEQQTRITYIEQKGKTLERQIKTIKKYLATSAADPVNAKLRLDSIANLYRDYIKYNDELASIQNDHHRLDNFHDIESQYFDIATAVTKLQKVEPLASSTLITSNITITE